MFLEYKSMIVGHKTLTLTYDYSKQYLPLQRSKDVQEVKKKKEKISMGPWMPHIQVSV